MNFTPDMFEKVLNGTKTQTRRPVKPNHFGNQFHLDGDDDNRINEVLIDREGKPSITHWVVGRTYAVAPGRGKCAVTRFKLLEIRKERADAITEADAIAEGFASREAFWDKLRELYGAKVDLTAPYWALTFVLVKS